MANHCRVGHVVEAWLLWIGRLDRKVDNLLTTFVAYSLVLLILLGASMGG